MKTFLLAFILFNIATFGEANISPICPCIADFAMTIQGTDDVQSLIFHELPETVMGIIDENADGCIIFGEMKKYAIENDLKKKYSVRKLIWI